MCICANVDPVACKAERYGFVVEEYHGEPCGCVCHVAIKQAGGRTPLAVDMGQICPHCGGRGSSGFGETWLECKRCNGTGQI